MRKRSSIVETKTLFARSDVRSASFTDKGSATFRFDQHFVWEERLGRGSFADVWAVRHKDRPTERYAIKCFTKQFRSRAERRQQLDEAELVSALPPHPHVVSYYRVWQDAQLMFVQMELCERGTLREQMAVEPLHLPEGDAAVWSIVQQLASALAFVHSHGLLHLDVKPDNVLVSNAALSMAAGAPTHGAARLYKLGDFGQSTTVERWDEHEGDAKYISKDLLESRPSTAADVFSFGIMLLEIKRGEELPGHGDEWEALRCGGSMEHLLPATATTDAQLLDLVEGMMSVQAEARLEAFACAVALPPTVPLPPSSKPPKEAPPCLAEMQAPQLRASVSRLLSKRSSDVASLIVGAARMLGSSGRSGSLFSPR